MLSQITVNIAREIISGSKFDFERFIKEHQYNHYMIFSHYNFYYSSPDFGKKWDNTDEQICYHRIEVCCHGCVRIPERNYAGVGSMAIVGFAPFINGRLKLYCMDCKPGFDFNTDPRIMNFNQETKQLQLF